MSPFKEQRKVEKHYKDSQVLFPKTENSYWQVLG